MPEDVLAVLGRIRTVSEMTRHFRDENRCRRLLEALVWPRGRICPACGYRRSTSIAGRDRGRTKRPGLYQCSNGACQHQFTVTTRTPLHSTKLPLPLRLWLQGLWLILQSDKGLPSVRLAEALGISQQAAWRMGHALRLMLRQEPPLDGIVEIDDLWLGGLPRKPSGDLGPGPGRGRKGQPRTTKTPVLALVQRPCRPAASAARAGSVRAGTVQAISVAETARIMTDAVVADAHLMSDEWSSFVALGGSLRRPRHGAAFRPGVCPRHRPCELGRGLQRLGPPNRRRGLPSHQSAPCRPLPRRDRPPLVPACRRRPSYPPDQEGRREVVHTLWNRIPPAQQLVTVFRSAVGREMRRTRDGSIAIRSAISAFA